MKHLDLFTTWIKFRVFHTFNKSEINKFVVTYKSWIGNKGVFINTLVGWAGQLEIFVVKLFDPLHKPPKLFESPSTSVKTFLTPPIARCIYQCLSLTPIYLVCTIGVPVTLQNWFYKAFLHGQTCSQVFQFVKKVDGGAE